MRGRTGGVISGARPKPAPDTGPGELVHAVTSAVGLRECAGCAKRRKWLNRAWRRLKAAWRPLAGRLRRRA